MYGRMRLHVQRQESITGERFGLSPNDPENNKSPPVPSSEETFDELDIHWCPIGIDIWQTRNGQVPV